MPWRANDRDPDRQYLTCMSMYCLFTEKYGGMHSLSWFSDFSILSATLLFWWSCEWPQHHMAAAHSNYHVSWGYCTQTAMRKNPRASLSSFHRTTSMYQGEKSLKSTTQTSFVLNWVMNHPYSHSWHSGTRSPWLVKPVFPTGSVGILDEAILHSVGRSHHP